MLLHYPLDPYTESSHQKSSKRKSQKMSFLLGLMFLGLEFFYHVFVWCVCAHVYNLPCVCTCAYGGQRLTLSVSLLSSPLCFTEAESLVEPDTHNSGSLTSQRAPWLLRFLLPRVGLQAKLPWLPDFYVNSEDQNPGPWACVANTLSTKPFPSLSLS